jgi:hypothetical protein
MFDIYRRKCRSHRCARKLHGDDAMKVRSPLMYWCDLQFRIVRSLFIVVNRVRSYVPEQNLSIVVEYVLLVSLPPNTYTQLPASVA